MVNRDLTAEATNGSIRAKVHLTSRAAWQTTAAARFLHWPRAGLPAAAHAPAYDGDMSATNLSATAGSGFLSRGVSWAGRGRWLLSAVALWSLKFGSELVYVGDAGATGGPNATGTAARDAAPSVAYAGRTKCCGFPIILEKEAIAVAMAGTNMKDARDHGADFMVTPCPLCHMSLDIYQERAGRAVKTELNLPILHLPQLLGLAMGLPAQDLGLSRHLISVDRIVTHLQNPDTTPSSLPAEPRT